MPHYSDMFSQMNKKAVDLFNSCDNEYEKTLLWVKHLGDDVDAQLLELKNNDTADILSSKTPIEDKKKRKAMHSDDDVNISAKKLCNSITDDESLVSSGKPKRNASKLAQQRINQNANMKLNTKMRRPSNTENLGNDSKLQVYVKLEKLSTSGRNTSENSLFVSGPVKSVLADVTNENMPPPAAKPKRLRKKVKKEVEDSDSEIENSRPTRSTRSSRKQQENDSKKAESTDKNHKNETRAKDSVVFIEERHLFDWDQHIPIVVLTDTEVETFIQEQAAKNTDNPIEESMETESITDSNNSQESVASTKAKKPKTTAKGKKKKGTTKKLVVKVEPDVQDEKEAERSQNNIVLTHSEVETFIQEQVAKNADNPIDESVETESIVDSNNSRESVASTKAKKPKTTAKGKNKKGTTKKLVVKVDPDVQDEKEAEKSQNNIVVNESLYEDALSDKPTENIEKISPMRVRTTELPSNTTFTVAAQVNLNSTHVIPKETPVKSPQQQLQKLSIEMQDAVQKTGVQLNCTVVLETINTADNTKECNLKATEVLTSPWKKADSPLEQPGLNSLLTSDEEEANDDDDHSIEVPQSLMQEKTPAADIKKKRIIKPKIMFSPYSNSPVKKRVAAFEKLKDTVDMPTRVTRTKTKLLAEKEQTVKKDPLPVPSTSRAPGKAMSKYLTPLGSIKLPSMIPSTDSKFKPYSTIKNTTNYDVPVKSASAIKLTRTELQERREEEQKRKMEREDESKRKKDALLQAKINEQRKKREEKQMKAQKAREAQEREKEEKLRRLLHDKEEKQRQDEQARKQWMLELEQKKIREKEKEEKLRIKILEHEAMKKRMNQKPPPLPSGDIEDSGDEAPKTKYIGPLWSQSQHLRKNLQSWSKVPSSYCEFLFYMHPQTPDLCEIFEHVDARIMRRNSSAYWRTPPRLSTLPRY